MELLLLVSANVSDSIHKSRFIRYDFEACDKLTTGQRHLHAHGIFTCKIKYAKVCTGI